MVDNEETPAADSQKDCQDTLPMVGEGLTAHSQPQDAKPDKASITTFIGLHFARASVMTNPPRLNPKMTGGKTPAPVTATGTAQFQIPLPTPEQTPAPNTETVPLCKLPSAATITFTATEPKSIQSIGDLLYSAIIASDQEERKASGDIIRKLDRVFHLYWPDIREIIDDRPKLTSAQPIVAMAPPPRPSTQHTTPTPAPRQSAHSRMVFKGVTKQPTLHMTAPHDTEQDPLESPLDGQSEASEEVVEETAEAMVEDESDASEEAVDETAAEEMAEVESDASEEAVDETATEELAEDESDASEEAVDHTAAEEMVEDETNMGEEAVDETADEMAQDESEALAPALSMMEIRSGEAPDGGKYGPNDGEGMQVEDLEVQNEKEPSPDPVRSDEDDMEGANDDQEQEEDAADDVGVDEMDVDMAGDTNEPQEAAIRSEHGDSGRSTSPDSTPWTPQQQSHKKRKSDPGDLSYKGHSVKKQKIPADQPVPASPLPAMVMDALPSLIPFTPTSEEMNSLLNLLGAVVDEPRYFLDESHVLHGWSRIRSSEGLLSQTKKKYSEHFDKWYTANLQPFADKLFVPGPETYLTIDAAMKELSEAMQQWDGEAPGEVPGEVRTLHQSLQARLGTSANAAVTPTEALILRLFTTCCEEKAIPRAAPPQTPNHATIEIWKAAHRDENHRTTGLAKSFNEQPNVPTKMEPMEFQSSVQIAAAVAKFTEEDLPTHIFSKFQFAKNGQSASTLSARFVQVIRLGLNRWIREMARVPEQLREVLGRHVQDHDKFTGAVEFLQQYATGGSIDSPESVLLSRALQRQGHSGEGSTPYPYALVLLEAAMLDRYSRESPHSPLARCRKMLREDTQKLGSAAAAIAECWGYGVLTSMSEEAMKTLKNLPQGYDFRSEILEHVKRRLPWIEVVDKMLAQSTLLPLLAIVCCPTGVTRNRMLEDWQTSRENPGITPRDKSTDEEGNWNLWKDHTADVLLERALGHDSSADDETYAWKATEITREWRSNGLPDTVSKMFLLQHSLDMGVGSSATQQILNNSPIGWSHGYANVPLNQTPSGADSLGSITNIGRHGAEETMENTGSDGVHDPAAFQTEEGENERNQQYAEEQEEDDGDHHEDDKDREEVEEDYQEDTVSMEVETEMVMA